MIMLFMEILASHKQAEGSVQGKYTRDRMAVQWYSDLVVHILLLHFEKVRPK